MRRLPLDTAFSLRALGASALLATLVCAPIHADWRDAFKRGIMASEQERWDEVVEAMREALAGRPAAEKRRIPIYSSKTVIYIPNAMLAIGLAKTGQCLQAWEHFRSAETQGIVQSDRERFRMMQQEKTACRDKLLKEALDEVQPLVQQATQIRADIDQLQRGTGARAIWDSKPFLTTGFDEGKEALQRATVRMEEGISSGEFEVVRSGAGLARTAITELSAVKRDFNVELNRGVASLILAAKTPLEAAEAKAKEVDAKKADAGRAWNNQLARQEEQAKAKLASARSDFEAGRSNSDGAKLNSAKTKANEAARELDRILATRIASVTSEPDPPPTRRGPTDRQKRSADLAVTEARQAQQALQGRVDSGSGAQRSRAEQLERQLEQLSSQITRARSGDDASSLVRLTTQMNQLTASFRDLESDLIRVASGGEETPSGGGDPTPVETGADGIPTALRSAASAYFSGDYEEVLQQVGRASFDGKAQGQALLFRAAAHFALYQLSGGADADSREAATAAAVEMKALSDTPVPTERYFSPAFLEFLDSATD